MGDTEFGSWGSHELGGYIRREEARKEWETMNVKTQHTPGPWQVITGSVYTCTSNLRDEYETRIAYMDRSHQPNAERQTMPVERDANARLIAAAPELLAACKLALKAFEENWAINWKELDDAIKKAEG